MPLNPQKWQTFITTVVILLVIFNFYLLFTESWPFSFLIGLQEQYLGAIYVAFTIISFILVLAIELVPFFIVKKLLERE